MGSVLVIQAKKSWVCIFDVVDIDVTNIFEPWPEDHVQFIKIEVQNRDIISFHELFILLSYKEAQERSIRVKEPAITVGLQPVEVIVHGLVEDLVE
jgi:hypothetical protein